MGFAMKDLLENFFYGISLMTGRLRVGDYIECDGIQGRVESIAYQSTSIVTLDGSVMAFLNATLFTKNFKNLTRNHSYELQKIPVGVAYGTDVEQVRGLITKEIEQLRTSLPDGRELIKPDQPVSVVFGGFGESSVDLLVAVWVLVDQKNGFLAKSREVIYNVLNKNHIEIPFPQRDVHIINKQ
jgi:small-conductance mechanosensitive channel